jgi:hypothetical protein
MNMQAPKITSTMLKSKFLTFLTLASLIGMFGCSKAFWDGFAQGFQGGLNNQEGPSNSHLASAEGNPLAVPQPRLMRNESKTQLSEASNLELHELTMEIERNLDEYGGGDFAQQGRFDGCTFFLQQGEEKYKIWKFTIPLVDLHAPSLRNYRDRSDRKNYDTPTVLLKTSKGRASIKSVFLQWTFGNLEPPLETQVASVEVLFSDRDMARQVALAFANAIEICSGK